MGLTRRSGNQKGAEVHRWGRQALRTGCKVNQRNREATEGKHVDLEIEGASGKAILPVPFIRRNLCIISEHTIHILELTSSWRVTASTLNRHVHHYDSLRQSSRCPSFCRVQ